MRESMGEREGQRDTKRYRKRDKGRDKEKRERIKERVREIFVLSSFASSQQQVQVSDNECVKRKERGRDEELHRQTDRQTDRRTVRPACREKDLLQFLHEGLRYDHSRVDHRTLNSI